jgi:hypothetical protein
LPSADEERQQKNTGMGVGENEWRRGLTPPAMWVVLMRKERRSKVMGKLIETTTRDQRELIEEDGAKPTC